MFDIDIKNLVPAFIYRDRNGYALSKALEAGLEYMLSAMGAAVNLVMDADSMPEWRLDEMAWELNSIYDYTADIAHKRKWIKDAVPLYAALGTKQAIMTYLAGYFEDVRVEEAADYSGSAFHFRVSVNGAYDGSKIAWAQQAIKRTQNVRSYFDGLYLGSGSAVKVSDTGAVVGTIPVYHSGDYACGELPGGGL